MKKLTGPDKFTGVPASQIGAYVPGFQLRTNSTERERTSYYLAAQWQKETVRATFTYARVENEIDSLEHTTEWFPDHDAGARVLLSDVTMDPDWSGSIATCSGPARTARGPRRLRNHDRGYRSHAVGPRVLRRDSGVGAYGVPVGTLGIGKHEKATTEDLSLNVKWNATDQLAFTFDVQQTKADADYVEVWGGGTFCANVFTKPELENPEVTFYVDPRTAIDLGDTRQRGTGFMPAPTSTTDPNGAFWLYAADSFREGTGQLDAYRIDSKFDFEGESWFKSVLFGVRYAEREQNNKEIGLNWGGISPTWAAAPACSRI